MSCTLQETLNKLKISKYKSAKAGVLLLATKLPNINVKANNDDTFFFNLIIIPLFF